ncbi:uncharacterized protein LOC124302622 [Neodiprion virginianus]|uniref:uncharacterized protein LOC124302622 n=1 Tax=Neodiprion virginianus TaxID=2961670 RepID=UPI001EE6DB12|nr:uncharacterized protein LOC124302622 [Neodiprion virginianus]
MGTHSTIFAVLGAALYLCAITLGEELSNDTAIDASLVASKSITTTWATYFPNRAVSVFSGNSITLRIVDEYEDLTTCTAKLPSGEEFNVLNATNDNLDDIRSYGQCGVTVRVNSNHTGTWRLDAIIGEEINYFATFSVTVVEDSNASTESTVLHVERGKSATMTFGPSDATSCRLTNPSGQTLPLELGSCQLEISTVTSVHEGFWTAKYSIAGRMDLIEHVTEVVVYDDSSFNASVTVSEDGSVNLLCRVRASSYSLCQFVKPNGEVLNVLEAIGDDRYLYYGLGTHSSTGISSVQEHDCGITILKPAYLDYGAWRCIVGTDSGLSGAVLTVPTRRRDENVNVRTPHITEDVYVTKGDSFTIKCSVDAELRYCWVRSPNGTAYSVSSTGSSPSVLSYDGMGLSLGECGAVVPASEETDEGDWQCRMGTVDGEEVGTNVNVVVTDTPLVPTASVVYLEQTSTQLSCFIPPGYEYSINYCRWIQPNGNGIQQSTNSRYKTGQTITSCELELVMGRKQSHDVGNWTCVAGLDGSSEEVSATIQVQRITAENNRNDKSYSLSLILTIGMAVTIIAGLVVVTIRSRLLKNKKSDLPPRYQEHSPGLPCSTFPVTNQS